VSIMLPPDSDGNTEAPPWRAVDLHPIDVAPHADKITTLSDRSGGVRGCWPWLGAYNRSGYGLYNFGAGSNRLAHRVSWVLWTGQSLTHNLTIDHLCRNRGCVNPGHLERVTVRVNSQRARNTRGESHPEHPHVLALVERAGWSESRDREGRQRRICPVCGTAFHRTSLPRHLRTQHLGGL
jgi:hypothetical protein